MIQKSSAVPSELPDRLSGPVTGTPPAQHRDDVPSVWVNRITGIGGVICLLFALSYWFIRPGHYRPVLILLTIAMFASILHSYVFENGDQS
jgi:hypothetical protein